MHLFHSNKLYALTGLMVFLALAMPVNAQPEFVFGEVPDLVMISNTDNCGGEIICETVYEVCDPSVTPVDITVEFFDGEKTEIGQLIKNKNLEINIVNPPCKQFTIRGEKSPFTNIDNIPCIKGICDSRFAWWNATFPYRKAINITKSSGTALTDFQMKFILDHEDEMQDDFDDLRFLSDCSDSATELDYFLETYDVNTTAFVWVKIPQILPIVVNQICLYYGNSGVTTTSNGSATFVLFDDFDNTDPISWTELDPNAKIDIDRSVDERLEWSSWNSMQTDAWVYYPLNFSEFDFDSEGFIMETEWNEGSANDNYAYCVGSFMQNANDCFGNSNAIGLLEPGATPTNPRFQSWTRFSSVNSAGSAFLATAGQTYYMTLRNTPSVNNLEIYPNIKRITATTYSNMTYGNRPTDLNYFFALSSYTTGTAGGSRTGHIDNIKLAKNSDPYPTYTPQPEEFFNETTPTEPTANVTTSVCDPDLIPLCEPFDDWTNAVCLGNSTLRKTKDCTVTTTDDNQTTSCIFSKSQDFNCDNGCFDNITTIGSGCAPTEIETMAYTGGIFIIFIVLSAMLMSKKKRGRR